MRLEITLFIFTLALAFISGNMAYFLKSEKKAKVSQLEDIRKLHLEIQDELQPYKRLDLNGDYPTSEHMKLIQNVSALPSTNTSVFLSSIECLKSKLAQISSNYINKENLWPAFLCNQVDKLPVRFFSTPPFIHSNGLSYAYMRYKMTRASSEKLRWLESHGKYMHLNELKKLHWPTSINQRFLINQPYSVIQNILQKGESFLTRHFYYIKTGNLKFFVINRQKAERFFARAGYIFDTTHRGCLFKIDQICWKRKPQNLQGYLSESTVILFIFTMILLGLTASGLYSRLKKKKLEEERKKHALRVLTHELRTPIASLILQLGELHKSLDLFPHNAQDQILKIESQIYRLKHLAQKSQGYLQTDGTKLIHLNQIKTNSIQGFIEEILLEYEEYNINFIFNKDTSLFIDPYWFSMCLNNLIENAIRYGKEEISVILDVQKNKTTITVKDEGSIPQRNLKELLKYKNKNSKGLGLGLNIVSKTLKEMGAKLILKNDPTSFIIVFKNDLGDEHE